MYAPARCNRPDTRHTSAINRSSSATPSSLPIRCQSTPNCSAIERHCGRLPSINTGSALIWPSRTWPGAGPAVFPVDTWRKSGNPRPAGGASPATRCGSRALCCGRFRPSPSPRRPTHRQPARSHEHGEQAFFVVIVHLDLGNVRAASRYVVHDRVRQTAIVGSHCRDHDCIESSAWKSASKTTGAGQHGSMNLPPREPVETAQTAARQRLARCHGKHSSGAASRQTVAASKAHRRR